MASSPASRRDATVQVGKVTFGADRLVLIAGPCVIESRESALRHAEAVREVTDRLGIPFVYKSSFDKANRSAGSSFRGPGLEAGLEILAAVRREVGVPVLTDVHETPQVASVAAVADVLQIPAFLCRQTDLILAAAQTGRVVNLKKGQFLSPWEMRHAVEKARSVGGDGRVLVTERGTTFGYNNLVTDFRALVVMRSFGVPVVYDATHSVQLPGAADGVSGGQREFIPALARAAVAVGIDGLFMEVHANPAEAKSDAATAFPLARLERLLAELTALDQVGRARRAEDRDA